MLRVQGFRVTIHSMRTEWIGDTLVVEGGGQTFHFDGRYTPRTLSSGELGVVRLAIYANSFEIFFISNGLDTDEGFELSYAPFLGAVPHLIHS